MSGQESKSAPSIGAVVNQFTLHIDSLETALPTAMVYFQELSKNLKKHLEDFEQAHCEVTQSDSERTVQIPVEHFRKWKRHRERDERFTLARVLVPRSILVTLISEYDAFLGQLLRAIFLLKPETLNPSEKQLSYSQVVACPNIEAVRDFIVEKEVEGVLRASHVEQFKWMEGRFGLPLTKDLKIWPQFIELTERRNLLVHADGIVSSHYLQVCQNHKICLDASVKEGVRLGVPQGYFLASYKCVYELGVKLTHVLWRKLFPEDRKNADTNLADISYELIDHGKYDLACSLLDFACETFKQYSSEWQELVFTVNRAQAYKWQGNVEKARSIMAKVDWSAKGDEFKLADAVLSENWERAGDLVKRIGQHGPVEKVGYQDWPLFREFREQEHFLRAYEEVFGERFMMSVTTHAAKVTSEESSTTEAPTDTGDSTADEA